ncbi:LysR family transcriptional regulator [Roseixanthobacter pseudopolyaromaticivorans]|uniref:LysR family transcriptional regulator n=1 Tax=Xanthobacteraceae TaxID=335928 RepID=UPI00372C1B69
MFNWNDLIFFLELARLGRLLPVARRLKVDHTTVSRRISELEKDLELKLFDRKPDGFVLTEHGHRLFAMAERMEQEASSIEETIQASPSAPKGSVRVASMEGIGAFYLAERFAELTQKEPGLVVELVTERHLINLTKREADISISFVPPQGQRLAVRKVGCFRLALYAAPDYMRRFGMPTARDQLPSHLFVDYVEDLVAIQPVHWLLDVLDPPKVSFRSTSMHAQQNAIARGAGIGLLPLFSAKSNARLIPILPDEVVVMRDIYVSVHEDLEFMGRFRAVLHHISEVVQRDAAYLTEF